MEKNKYSCSSKARKMILQRNIIVKCICLLKEKWVDVYSVKFLNYKCLFVESSKKRQGVQIF